MKLTEILKEKDKAKNKPLSLVVTPALHDRIRKAADATGTSMNSIGNTALELFLDQLEKELESK